MPIVTIQVTREATKKGTLSVTAEEKAALIKGASELLPTRLLRELKQRHNDLAGSVHNPEARSFQRQVNPSIIVHGHPSRCLELQRRLRFAHYQFEG
jgi:hypothetical protein